MVWDGNALHKALCQGFFCLTHAANCRKVGALARVRCCSTMHPAAVFKMAAGSLQLKQTKSWASELRRPACPAHSRSGPASSHLHARPASLPWFLSCCCALGIKAAFVPRRQMAVPGAVAYLVVGHGRHQPRSLLMRNAQDIHGRGHRSKWLALNYIFSDCKLLLTASLPSLQLTFLTKGHLLTCTPCFLRLFGASSQKEG